MKCKSTVRGPFSIFRQNPPRSPCNPTTTASGAIYIQFRGVIASSSTNRQTTCIQALSDERLSTSYDDFGYSVFYTSKDAGRTTCGLVEWNKDGDEEE